MTDVALTPTPAQERMANARAARAAKLEETRAETAASLNPDIVALAKSQRLEREAAEAAEALQAAAKEAGVDPLKLASNFGPGRMERAAALAAKEEIERHERAREAVEAPVTHGVMVRVLKAGHNKIAMGIHVPAVGDANYPRGARFRAPRRVAEALEDRGLVEIEDEADEA